LKNGTVVMTMQAIFTICALLAAGCSEADFGGSNASSRYSRGAGTSSPGAQAETPAPAEDKNESATDLPVSDEEFDSGTAEAYRTVELSVTSELVAAPAVRIGEIEVFNRAVYLRLECETVHPEHGDCQDGLDQERHYSLAELGIALVATTLEDDKGPLSHADLLQLEARVPADSRELESGAREVGPLAIPELGTQQALAVVVRYTPADLGRESASFKLFVADGKVNNP
jgi:hypothetical protein